ncbi:uncharacterized protein LOC126549904 [Aphis gossypii]|uniref:uncharacterized protein LOC126549904 n=1 Tax=Aphis gossypii TaxID=80765 RepID=UPI0021593F7C|nr:uncharacterized protein LOC126549904 [Aphis gossypii]
MDNASHHSTLAENYPKSNSRKSDVQKWLKDKNIPYSNLEILAELKMKLALERGHEVIRLSPNHSQYNAIELIWAQVKNEVAKKNNTFKMVDIERLTHEALDSVTVQDWEKCVRHAETIQSQDYEKEVHRDAILEPIILTILPGDSDSSDDEDTDNNEDIFCN